MWQIKPLQHNDRVAVLQLWHRGWHDAHAHLVPAGILHYRTPDYFSLWLDQCADEFYAMVEGDSLLGFVSIKGSEVVKLYVSSVARGKGFAQSLLGHGEKLLAQRGVETAELFCTVGNVRAQKFYVREGWKLCRTFADELWLPSNGPAENFLVQTEHYKKQLGHP